MNVHAIDRAQAGRGSAHRIEVLWVGARSRAEGTRAAQGRQKEEEEKMAMRTKCKHCKDSRLMMHITDESWFTSGYFDEAGVFEEERRERNRDGLGCETVWVGEDAFDGAPLEPSTCVRCERCHWIDLEHPKAVHPEYMASEARHWEWLREQKREERAARRKADKEYKEAGQRLLQAAKPSTGKKPTLSLVS